jgi:hypothetical protein
VTSSLNEKVLDNLKTLDRDITKALQACTVRMMGSCQSVEESVRAMDKIVDVLSGQQQRAVWALVVSLLELQNEDNVEIVPIKDIRQYVIEAAEQFKTELIENLKLNLERDGYSNVLDPNAALRDEILETIDEDL